MTAGADHLLNLYERLRRSWSTETRRHWCPDRPASGQCGVTAPVVHDEPGGRILKTDVNGTWHFYNLVDGRRIDFTMTQFETPIGYNDLPSNRDEALADCSVEQYRLLRARAERSPIDLR